jgi:hypothetical protein
LKCELGDHAFANLDGVYSSARNQNNTVRKKNYFLCGSINEVGFAPHPEIMKDERKEGDKKKVFGRKKRGCGKRYAEKLHKKEPLTLCFSPNMITT